jgi:hypothetical protein
MIPILIIAVCVIGAAVGNAAEREIIVRGRVVDANGKPVAKAIVGTNWTPMGWYDDEGKRHTLADRKFPLDDARWIPGAMQPTSDQHNSITDENGEFRCTVIPGYSCLLAFDEKQNYSGMADFDSRRLQETLVIRLDPAIEVTGRVVAKSTGKPIDWCGVSIELADEPADPLAFRRFMMVWTVNGDFKTKLPPGNFVFDAKDPDINLTATPKITLTIGEPRVNIGEILLIPSEPTREQRIERAKAEQRVIEVQELVGKPMPQWHVTDGRGIDPKAGIEQFRGRWALIYFWHMSCAPCARVEVPRLTKFVADHHPISERIAVVSFMHGAESWRTMADADKFLDRIGKRYWSEPWNRLPQAFDSTHRSRESIAEELFGTWILVDPKGIVAATGDDTSRGLVALTERSGL